MNLNFCIGIAPFSWGRGVVRTQSGRAYSFGPFRLFIFGSTFEAAKTP